MKNIVFFCINLYTKLYFIFIIKYLYIYIYIYNSYTSPDFETFASQMDPLLWILFIWEAWAFQMLTIPELGALSSELWAFGTRALNYAQNLIGCIYIYIYREREIHIHIHKNEYMYVCIYYIIYIYIYIFIYSKHSM